MSIWGKLIGGGLGLAMGGPLGALIGGVAGHFYDKQKDAEDEARLYGPGDGAGAGPGVGSGPEGVEGRQIAFATAIIVLSAKMAKADGVVTKDEIRAFRERFHIPPEDEATVGRIFNEARRDATGFEPYAEQVAMMYAHEPAVLEEFMGALFHIAKADGQVAGPELAFLRKTALIFGFSGPGFERLKAMHLDPPEERQKHPYEILGVPRDASDDEIKAAYRTLLREHHPDKLMAQGMPQEFIDVATEKMAAINAAYDKIKAERGLK